MVAHFDIPLSAVGGIFILDVDTARMVREDSDLICRRYFLALMKKGYELPFEERDLASYPLITDPLFHRTVSSIYIKVISPFNRRRRRITSWEESRCSIRLWELRRRRKCGSGVPSSAAVRSSDLRPTSGLTTE